MSSEEKDKAALKAIFVLLDTLDPPYRAKIVGKLVADLGAGSRERVAARKVKARAKVGKV